MANVMLKLETLNTGNRSDFTAALADVFEHSPWVPERAWHRRPFADINALLAALTAEVEAATTDEQLDLLRAHPQLAGKSERAETLTCASAGEQAGALDELSREEAASLSRMNRAYTGRFGFPFIIAVRDHDRHGILAELERRVVHDSETERRTALEQVAKIAKHRLEDLVDG